MPEYVVQRLPEHVKLAAQIIMLSSAHDLQLSRLAVILTKEPAALYIFYKYMGAGNKKVAALSELVAEAFDEELHTITKMILGRTKETRKHRHIFAHWEWRFNNLDTDKLVMVDPEAIIAEAVELQEYSYNRRSRIRAETRATDHSSINCETYTIDKLNNIITRANRTDHLLRMLRTSIEGILSFPQNAGHVRSQLFAVPEIRAGLQARNLARNPNSL